MTIIDNHLHLEDREAEKFFPVEKYLEKTRERGVDFLGFSDHAYVFQEAKDINFNSWQNERMKYSLADYVGLIDDFKKDNPQVMLGLEVDYNPQKEKEIGKFIKKTEKKFDLDFFTGSIHWMNDWGFDLDAGSYAREMEKLGPDFIYLEYFRYVKAMIESGLFDVIAHIDLIKIFGARTNDKRYLQETVSLLKNCQQVIELNTNGKNKPIGEFYPGREFLEACFSAGVEVTLGSDAHSADRVGEYFDEAVAMLREIGYEKIVYFEKRKKKYLNL